ncbi:peptidoglycan-binding domain-containing protein [Microbacterium indicum]|uniref:peptidoglycan-binding domain-containing protein n=1 Tax=Microbacterium indicum TaxID=358100 RepID=UPI0012EC67F8|nr:hypothetical protein [Microbacterium indicum]
MITASLVAVGLVCAGAAAALLLRPAVPASLAGDAAATTAPAAQREFADEQAVDVRLTMADSASIVAPRDGRVTALQCAPGAEAHSGDTMVSVDGRPLLSLATSTPLWRDLRIGDTGADVTALQETLTADGYATAADGVVGSSTADAVRSAFRAIGVTGPSGQPEEQAGDEDEAAQQAVVLAVADVVWLPAPSLVLQECATVVGGQMAAGDVLATSPDVVTGVRITGQDSSALPGDRVVAVGDVAGALTADQTIVDPEFLRDIVTTPEFSEAAPQDHEVVLPGTSSLTAPVAVLAVPASAVFGLAGTAGCISIDGSPVPVDVAGSELGQTLVAPREPLDGVSQVDAKPEADASCAS